MVSFVFISFKSITSILFPENQLKTILIRWSIFTDVSLMPINKWSWHGIKDYFLSITLLWSSSTFYLFLICYCSEKAEKSLEKIRESNKQTPNNTSTTDSIQNTPTKRTSYHLSKEMETFPSKDTADKFYTGVLKFVSDLRKTVE